jgi:hypothetical protein
MRGLSVSTATASKRTRRDRTVAAVLAGIWHVARDLPRPVSQVGPKSIMVR